MSVTMMSFCTLHYQCALLNTKRAVQSECAILFIIFVQ